MSMTPHMCSQSTTELSVDETFHLTIRLKMFQQIPPNPSLGPTSLKKDHIRSFSDQDDALT